MLLLSISKVTVSVGKQMDWEILEGINQEVASLWMNGNINQIDRLSDDSLSEILLRTRIQGLSHESRLELYAILKSRPTFSGLFDIATSVEEYNDSSLKSLLIKLRALDKQVSGKSVEIYFVAGGVVGLYISCMYFMYSRVRQRNSTVACESHQCSAN
jgi:hypothetical protein